MNHAKMEMFPIDDTD